MTPPAAQPYTHFRLDLEQQQQRAADLLEAAKQGDAEALLRLRRAGSARTDSPASLTLAAAQHCIARELRVADWAALERHIQTMAKLRAALGEDTRPADADCRTLHIRCGHDIEHDLRSAGLCGDFHPHLNPYLQGPVTDTPDWLERRARFITDSVAPNLELEYETVLRSCQMEEQRLVTASREYERVALWLEHDRYDQFVLLRCLAGFAEHGAPARLELVGPNDFPGATRFVGLGQLPPEALRLLWEQRRQLGDEHLAYGATIWRAFRASDPRPLAALVRAGTPLLPDLAAALHRHLQELPSVAKGLGLTQQLLLDELAQHGRSRVGRLVAIVMHERDPLPGLGDLGYDHTLRELGSAALPLVQRSGGSPYTAWHGDEIDITAHGRKLLDGRLNWQTAGVPDRWVGGVRVAARQPNWYWDEPTLDVVRR